MAALTGILSETTSFDATLSAGSPAWLANLITFSNTLGLAHKKSLTVAGTITNNLPIALSPAALTGVFANSYSEIFYNQILIEPLVINVGSLVGDQVRTFKVFNGYFTTKDLNTIVTANFDGMVLTGDSAPKTFSPLEEIEYQISIDDIGPPTIAGTITFNFADAVDVRVVSIGGSRIVALPYFGLAPFEETMEWATEVTQSYGGKEQRIALRRAPRIKYKMNAHIPKPELNRVDNLFYGWKQRIWALPLWPEAQKVASVLSTESSIQVDTRYSEYIDSQLAILWETPTKFDVFTIDSHTDTQVNADRNINDNYSDAFIMPVKLVRMTTKPIRKTDGYDGMIACEFETMQQNTIETTTYTQFNGEDLDLVTPLLLTGSLPDSYERRVNLLDFKTGAIELFDPWTYTRIQRKYKLFLEGMQTIWEHKQWLHKRRGKLVPFYAPNYEESFKILSQGLITNPVEVAEDYSTTQASERTHVIFFLKNGTYILKTITGQSVNASGNVDINLDTVLNVNSEDINFASYVGRKRLSTDKHTFKWLNSKVVETQVSTTEVQL